MPPCCNTWRSTSARRRQPVLTFSYDMLGEGARIDAHLVDAAGQAPDARRQLVVERGGQLAPHDGAAGPGADDHRVAVDALRAGAHDFVAKPVNRDELLHRIQQIESMRGLREENRVLRKSVGGPGAHRFTFASPAMRDVERLAGKVAPTDSTVLVTGESGTGKGVLARSIHERSLRAAKPFIAVNCAAIPENLLESELFGHEKGSFTGAVDARKGYFETVNGGTIFLDEIGELSPGIQAKLLRFIQEGEVYRVGGKDPIKVDIR